MFGQGNYTPQFRHGPPTPPPPLFQPAPPPPPPFQQAPAVQPPPPIHQGPLHPSPHTLPPHQAPAPPQYHVPHGQQPIPPPPSAPMNMGQLYMHPPPPVVPPYPQTGPSYAPHLQAHNAHYIPPPMPPPPPRVLPPPPPPSQGQVMYRTPPPPPPGIQHVPAPPPPHPAGFVSITPTSFGQNLAGDAQPPSLPPPPPPPPPPPSSPPPLPPSPPPPSSPFVDFKGPSADTVGENVNVNQPSSPHAFALPMQDVSPNGVVGEVEKNFHVPKNEELDVEKNVSLMEEGALGTEKKISLVEGKALRDFSSPPPKPGDEEVLKNIEVLCQFIQNVGPAFEEEARRREVSNPRFSFLFGGEPGSAAAVGHAYFQWMKKKCQVKSDSQEDQHYTTQSGLVEDEGVALSPADSDMDMEDDVSHPDGGRGFNVLNRDTKGSDIHVAKEFLCSTQGTASQLEQEVGLPGTISCTESSKLEMDEKVDDASSFMEELSPVPASPAYAEGATADNAQASIRPSPGDSSLAKVSPAAAGFKTEEVSRVFVKDRSPFRLIQGYASDDSDEDDKEEDTGDVTSIRASVTSPIGSTGIHQDQGFKLYSSPMKSSDLEIASTVPTGLDKPSQLLMAKEVECSENSPPRNTTSTMAKDIQLGSHQQDEDNLDDSTVPIRPSQDRDKMEGSGINNDRQDEKFHCGVDAKEDSPALAVDEFGRLVRQATSDSDSERTDYGKRRGKRSRSRSRSQSPQESRWRRRSRSPRRRQKRSRSCSWSPKRSRSRSPPAYRRASEFARRDRDQPPECFNFIHGRCFRGASCRFLHRDLGRHRGRQQEYWEGLEDSRNYSVHDGAPSGKSHQGELVATEMDAKEHHNIVQNAKSPRRDEGLNEKVRSGSETDETQLNAKNEAGHLQVAGKSFNEAITQRKEAEQVEKTKEKRDVDHTWEERVPSWSLRSPPAGSLPDQPSLSEKTRPLPYETSRCTSGHNATAEFHDAMQTDETTTFQNQSPATLTLPSQSHCDSFPNYVTTGPSAAQSLLPKEFPPPSFAARGGHHPPTQLPTPALQGPSLISHQSNPSPSDMSLFHRPISGEFHSYSVPSSNPAWSNYPPPPPSGPASRPAFHIEGNPPLQLQQNAMPPRNDFNSQPSMRPYQPGEPACPQGVDFHPQPFRSVDSSHQTSFHMDEIRQRSMPVGNRHDQPFVGDGRSAHPLMPEGSQFMSESQREQHLHRQSFPHYEVRNPLPGQGYPGSSSFQQGNIMHPQPPTVPRESLRNQPHSVPGFLLPTRVSSREEFPLPPVRDMPYPHNQGPFAQQHPSSGAFASNFGAGVIDPSGQRFPSSFPENNLPPHLLDIGVTKVTTHYNPFASTFEQPPAILKFGSSIGGPGLRTTASPPNPRRSVEQFLPREGVVPPMPPSGDSSAHGYMGGTSTEMPPAVHKQFVRVPAAGDPYDPLFDSIEPSSNMFKKLDGSQEPLANDAATMSKISSLRKRKLADIEENARQKFVASAALKSDADELGEVATDAEVGIVENGSPQPGDGQDWSPVIQIDVGNTAAGEIEIDQVPSPGRSKKNKDSRSMKLFKIALADFVKEVLKPSWRQGNMSKEAFKTIVKKTVDKVSGAMSSHQIPKTQAKINQYVVSSQRKLTKLVMGYVDKYVKM